MLSKDNHSRKESDLSGTSVSYMYGGGGMRPCPTAAASLFLTLLLAGRPASAQDVVEVQCAMLREDIIKIYRYRTGLYALRNIHICTDRTPPLPSCTLV